MSRSTTPPPKKTSRSRVGTVMRRSSTSWGLPGLPNHSGSATPPLVEPDSASTAGSTSPKLEREASTASLTQVDTTPPPSQMAPSTIPDSPAREAAALASEAASPNQSTYSLLGGVLTADPPSDPSPRAPEGSCKATEAAKSEPVFAVPSVVVNSPKPVAGNALYPVVTDKLEATSRSTTPPPKKTFRSRVGPMMRRYYTSWGLPGLPNHSGSATPPLVEPDSASTAGSTSPKLEREASTASLTQVDTTPPNQMAPSTIPDSPAREAAALASEAASPNQSTSPLSGGVLTAEPPSDPSPRAPEGSHKATEAVKSEPAFVTDELEEMPADRASPIVHDAFDPLSPQDESTIAHAEPVAVSLPAMHEVTLPRKLLPSSSHTHAVFSARNVEPDDFFPEAMLQDLSKYITKDGDYPVARGGFGEIWKSTFHIDDSSIKVAVKALQVYLDDQLQAAKRKKIKRIMRELRICANLNHANILRIYGYTYGFGPFPAIVSPWAENGDLTGYLEREGAALTLVRRFQLLRDIIAGLHYLHTNSVIHGDFNGPNVLVRGDGTACVADFGLSLMYSEAISASQASWTSTIKGNMRWMAPELLLEREDGSQARPTKQSDMYSFGGIMLQVLTNKVPYYHFTNDAAIILCIAKSQMPSRSRYPELPEKYWSLIEKCWSTDPRDRPSAEGAETTIRNEFYSLSGSQ